MPVFPLKLEFYNNLEIIKVRKIIILLFYEPIDTPLRWFKSMFYIFTCLCVDSDYVNFMLIN